MLRDGLIGVATALPEGQQTAYIRLVLGPLLVTWKVGYTLQSSTQYTQYQYTVQ